MKKRGKWIMLGSALTLLLLFGLYQFFAYVLKDQWEERSIAAAAAKSGAGLTVISKAQKSVWDENSIYWVFTGKDSSDTELVVWVRFTADGKLAADNAVHAEKLANGTSEREIRAILKAESANISIERLMPGVYNGEYAWQAFYKEEGRYYYRFYRFSDGSPIGDGYSLPKR